MEDTVLIKPANLISKDSHARRRNPRILTTENNHYLRKIEELANTMLRFFREKELLEEQANRYSKALSKPPQSTSVATDVCTDRKSKTKPPRSTFFATDVSSERFTESKTKPPRSTSVDTDVSSERFRESKAKRPQSTSAGKDGCKKRKVPKKAVVINDITERLNKFIANEMRGTDVKLVIQKKLFTSDTKKVLNRLNMPIKQVEKGEFLTADEKRILKKGSKIEVRLLGPTLEMYKDPMNLRLWHMKKTDNYVLTTNWYRFWSKNKLHLKRDWNIQVWSFRKSDHELCFAVVCVEEPEVKVDDSDS